MNIDSRLSFDQKEDRVLGQHKNTQVIMAKNPMSSWKQPVYCDFDQSVNASILNNIISSLENIGYEVVAIDSNRGGKNYSLWNENPEFKVPVDESRNIWVCADVPHLFKLLRNHILGSGISISNDK